MVQPDTKFYKKNTLRFHENTAGYGHGTQDKYAVVIHPPAQCYLWGSLLWWSCLCSRGAATSVRIMRIDRRNMNTRRQ